MLRDTKICVSSRDRAPIPRKETKTGRTRLRRSDLKAAIRNVVTAWRVVICSDGLIDAYVTRFEVDG
jgi:hypothetical protein